MISDCGFERDFLPRLRAALSPRLPAIALLRHGRRVGFAFSRGGRVTRQCIVAAWDRISSGLTNRNEIISTLSPILLGCARKIFGRLLSW
jgi:hypothetical protein